MWAICIGCGPRPASDWSGFDKLTHSAPRPARRLGDIDISEADYQRFRRLGERYFRGETLGNERTVTDVVGLMQGTVTVPCDPPSYGGCYTEKSVLEYYAAAVDALDGVTGNLFVGNGGPDGTGYTHDLVIRFPPGTKLLGIDVPEELHTGLDVEAGSSWPIGIVAVPAPREDHGLPYLIDPAKLDAGPAPTDDKYRIGITCALCHYSLDVDWDGKTDLRSAWIDQPTPGSPYRPEESWAIGNQDLHVGWLFALTANPLLGTTVLGGPIGYRSPEASIAWTEWVRDNYVRATTAVKQEVVRSMLTQPRGYADITTNSKLDTVQFPLLFTRGVWPYNYDGSLVNASDRNNSVWTTALDFTGLIGLTKDRAQAGQNILYWEPASIYNSLDAETYADLFVYDSPAVHHDPSQRRLLKDDILGKSDGVPGLLRPDSVLVMGGPAGMVPDEVIRIAKEKGVYAPLERYHGDAAYRGAVMALVGMRVRTTPAIREQENVAELARRYPGLNEDEFMNDATSLMLDSLDPPRNHSPLLENARGLVAQGYQVFREAGCVGCHRGPYMTDNLIHRQSVGREGSVGLPYAPSTAGWRRPGHHRGPGIGTQPDRMVSSRPLALFVAPDYDPRTGKAYAAGSPPSGLFEDRQGGYKTAALRYLWGSAPFLHDGGVGVALRPGAAPAGDDLKALLSRGAGDKLYGMGAVLGYREENPGSNLRADAALSLQAMVLESERKRVIQGNRKAVYPVPRGGPATDIFGNPVPERVAAVDLGVAGVGHEFWVEDVVGGDRVTALVAFLLSIDDDAGAAPSAGSTPPPTPAPETEPAAEPSPTPEQEGTP